MPVLEMIVNKEVKAAVRRGINVGLLQKCWKRAAEADRTGKFTRGLPTSVYEGRETELSYVVGQSRLLKVAWSLLEECVGLAEAGCSVDATRLEDAYSRYCETSKWFELYAHNKLPSDLVGNVAWSFSMLRATRITLMKE